MLIIQVMIRNTTACRRRYILITNEALYLPGLEYSLMNLNQLSHYIINMYDNLYASEPMKLEKSRDDKDFIAYLRSEGTNIFINT